MYSFVKSLISLSVLVMHEGQKGYIVLWYTAKNDKREWRIRYA